jgi:formate dehydrogenase subunit delta
VNTAERLVYMANQIATNLATDADPVTAIADHIQLFWDPRMKKLILENDRTGLSPSAAAAISRLEGARSSADAVPQSG